jgi:type IV secretory pathway VirD2 relaxase
MSLDCIFRYEFIFCLCAFANDNETGDCDYQRKQKLFEFYAKHGGRNQQKIPENHLYSIIEHFKITVKYRELKLSKWNKLPDVIMQWS